MASGALLRRLDRARLDGHDLTRAWPRLVDALGALRDGHGAYLAGRRVIDLRLPAQSLVDTLGEVFGVPGKRVFLRDSPRPHQRRDGRIVSELHGICDPAGPLEIYTRTAARAQPIALKTLLDTLLHEWVHHYDYSLFDESVHCGGFYERLAQLYRPARDWVDGVARDGSG